MRKAIRQYQKRLQGWGGRLRKDASIYWLKKKIKQHLPVYHAIKKTSKAGYWHLLVILKCYLDLSLYCREAFYKEKAASLICEYIRIHEHFLQIKPLPVNFYCINSIHDMEKIHVVVLEELETLPDDYIPEHWRKL